MPSKLDQLITELCPDGVEFVKLSEIAVMTRGIRVVKSQLTGSGKYPVYQNSMTPLGYYEESNCRADTVFIISAGAAGEIGYSNVDFWAADDCFCFACPEQLQSRFLYYALLCQQEYLFSRVRRASVPRLARAVVEQLRIPIPPLPVQHEIVRILDKFTELTAALTKELAAEIVARKKQYEYYRNYLLTFENVGGQLKRTADCGLRTADCGLRTADCGLRTADCGLRPEHRESAVCELQPDEQANRDSMADIGRDKHES